MAKKKIKRKKTSPRKSASVKKAKAKTALKSKPPKKKKIAARPKPKPKSAPRKSRGRPVSGELVSYERRGMGARSGGQSGDTQGIAARPDVDSESVEGLLEEGQSFEAEVVDDKK